MSYEKTKLMNLEDGQTLLGAIDGKMSDLKSALNQIQPNAEADLKNEKFWRYGTISGSGVISDNHDRSNIITAGMIGFDLQYSVQLETISMYLCKYKNGAFVSRSIIGVSIGKIEMDSTFDSYRLMLLTKAESTSYTVAQMLDFTKFMLSERMYELNDSIGELNDSIGELNDSIGELNLYNKGNYVDLKNNDFWMFGTVTSDGTIDDKSSLTAYNTVFTPGIITFPVQFNISNDSTLYYAKYKDGRFVERTTFGATKQGKLVFDSTFNSCRLILLTSIGAVAKDVLLSLITSMVSERKEEQDAINDRILTIQNGVSPEYVPGVIGTGGAWSAGNNDNFCTLIIRPSFFQTIDVSCDDGYLFSLAKYNGDTFSERSSWYYHSGGVIEFDNSYGYRINIAKQTASGSTLEQMLEHFSIVINGNDMPTLRREIESSGADGLDFLNRISCCYTGNKICHYSVDDTYALLKDLTDNANTYTSIFENPTLAAVREIHNDTGMCITFNTFNTSTDDASYSIVNVPQKTAFQAEFQANKDWLKFAFHAESTPTNYNTATGISAAYDTFVTAIYKLTGDYDCIDRITRLGYFGGTLENVLTIKNKDHGIIGLLCADTTNRASYYLSSEQNEQVQQKGMCIDLANELVFIKTITRSLGATAQNEVKNNLCYQKYVEFFSHEYESSWINNCRIMCQWAKDNGYVFAFPSLIFDLKDTF